jgi:hypothetical protein
VFLVGAIILPKQFFTIEMGTANIKRKINAPSIACLISFLSNLQQNKLLVKSVLMPRNKVSNINRIKVNKDAIIIVFLVSSCNLITILF